MVWSESFSWEKVSHDESSNQIFGKKNVEQITNRNEIKSEKQLIWKLQNGEEERLVREQSNFWLMKLSGTSLMVATLFLMTCY